MAERVRAGMALLADVDPLADMPLPCKLADAPRWHP